MHHLKSPDPLDFDTARPTVFLAGSIELGAAEDWQTVVARALEDLDITLLNPRRDAWDASWPQDVGFAPFREQVEWELEAQELASLIVFYFSPATKSPITLLELGLAAGRRDAVVCCPEGFWRKGNVDVVCARYGIPQVGTLEALIDHIRSVYPPGRASDEPAPAGDDPGAPLDPFRPVVEELSCWRIESGGEVCATVRYGRDAEGNPALEIDDADENVREFICYYLDDPLNARPVYIHGLGYQEGPYTRNQEVFDTAMSVLGHTYPAYRTIPI